MKIAFQKIIESGNVRERSPTLWASKDNYARLGHLTLKSRVGVRIHSAG